MPPTGVDRATWTNLPLAKRRLATEGPVESGHAAARDAALVVAAELRLHHVAEELALHVVREMPLLDLPGKQRHYRKQFPKFVRWAYAPPDGRPLLTGCPRSPRHSEQSGVAHLRDRFAPYCDNDCARTCRIRRASHVPAAALPDSPFEPVWNSSIWVRGGGLGAAGKDVYEILAALATTSPDASSPVWAASRYLATRLGHIVGQSNVRTLLRKMDSLGLVTLEDARRGLYRVHTLTEEQVADLEAFLGTAEKVQERQRDVDREWLAHREWLNEWDDADAMVAGTGRLPDDGSLTNNT
jgi:hypothetical protein